MVSLIREGPNVKMNSCSPTIDSFSAASKKKADEKGQEWVSITCQYFDGDHQNDTIIFRRPKVVQKYNLLD